MNHKKQSKMNIPMCLAGVLLCLTLLSMHFTSGFYAKYTATGSGDDDARVAEFKVTDDMQKFMETLEVAIAPNDEGAAYSATINVENDSEVAINYIVKVENITDNIPLKFKIGEDESEKAVIDACTKTFSMEADSDQVCKIDVMWDSEDALDYMGMVDLIKVTVNAEQID